MPHISNIKYQRAFGRTWACVCVCVCDFAFAKSICNASHLIFNSFSFALCHSQTMPPVHPSVNTYMYHTKFTHETQKAHLRIPYTILENHQFFVQPSTLLEKPTKNCWSYRFVGDYCDPKMSLLIKREGKCIQTLQCNLDPIW